MAQKTGGSSVCPQVSNTNAEGFTYDYDEYGNRWHQTLATGSGPGPQPSYTFDVNNHLPNNCGGGTSNFCYDDAGNLKYDGLGGNWSLDSEGKMFAYTGTSASATYTYDALGQRAERTVNGTTNDYVYDNQGNVNTKASGSFTGWNSSELYLGGLHVNTYVNGSTYFSHNDHLGSERVETDPSGNTNGSATTNLLFGEWTSNAMQSELGFTGDLLDNADGDVFHTPNRQYSETQGRWMRPDPAGLAAVNAWNPQTWNRYTYVTNNPLSYRDPTGLVSMPNVGTYANGGGGASGGFDCQQDGIDQSCATINSVLQGGGAVQCPYNNCLAEDGNNRPVYFWASTNGNGNYYNYSGPGALYYSFASDAIAAAQFGKQYVNGLPIEPIGNLYRDQSNGVFTYDLTGLGNCDESGNCYGSVSPYATPEGYDLVGFWHDHPDGTWPASSAEDRATADIWGIPIVTGTGQYVLIYAPGSGCANGDAVLAGGNLPGACKYTYQVP